MTLYHYTSGQGIFGILNSGELHCSNVDFLNDPSEKSYFTDLLKVVLTDSNESNTIYQTLYNESYIQSIEDPFETFIASFSKNNDSLSMWNYYAKGNGYNLGLDIDKVIETNENSKLYIQKIELSYDKAKQIEETIIFILSQKANYKRYLEISELLKTNLSEDMYYDLGYEQHNITGEFNHYIHNFKLGYKHQAYESEEEVRLIISEHPTEKQKTKFKISENGVFVEYLPLKLNLETNLKSVTVHPLNGQLHLQGAKKFVNSILSNKPEINISSIPFRIV
jgi:hypothetical protein